MLWYVGLSILGHLKSFVFGALVFALYSVYFSVSSLTIIFGQ